MKKKIRIDHSVFVFVCVCVCGVGKHYLTHRCHSNYHHHRYHCFFGGKFKRNDKFYFCFLKLNDYVQARELPDDKLSGDTKIKDNFFFFFFCHYIILIIYTPRVYIIQRHIDIHVCVVDLFIFLLIAYVTLSLDFSFSLFFGVVLRVLKPK